ncbi:MAG: PAS domain S-box protein [Campylobacterota bacterium]|nr:PAS domain S-box protein [Campylobacterota bacterium]
MKQNMQELLKFTKTLRVLYVEDNKEARESTIAMLENFFDTVDVAVDGDDGYEKYLNYYETSNRYFDLVISDLNMPKMEGTEMAKLMFDLNKYQHILIISAYNDAPRLEELINMGISNFMHKPLKLAKLVSVLWEVAKDIQNRRNKDKEFKEIEQLNNELDVLVDSFDTYVIASRTDLKGLITYASKAYEIISGYAESELLGKPHSIVRHPDMPKSAFKDMWETIQDGRLWVGEVKNLKKDGTYYWVKANVAPYFDKHKNHIGYSAIRIDITAQKEVEELHKEVNNLLNNSAQGFLSFNEEFTVADSFSKECLKIFESATIQSQNIANLLFANDSVKKDLFTDGIERAVKSDEQMIKEMFLSLLPSEHRLNSKDIGIQYKILTNNTFMLILTDITKTKKLEHKIQEQHQIQKMIVAVASNQNDFLELKYDFENFCKHPSSDIKILLRELHTFKGIFAQKEITGMMNAVHDLETHINQLLQEDNISTDTIVDTINEHDLLQDFEKDLETIRLILGEKFVQQSRSLSIDVDAFEGLEKKLKELNVQNLETSLEGILLDVEEFKHEPLYSMLNIYPSTVKQMAQRVQKEIYPLEIQGDKELRVSDTFKPFAKSLVHLFNNCVDHGIENIETRVENGKDEIGTLYCKFERADDQVILKIGDDGTGINTAKLLQIAIDKSMITQDASDIMSEQDKLMLVFLDSLSTKNEVTTTSGRGVGMSAIQSEVNTLNGNIEIHNSIGKGVEFIFTLPLYKKDTQC